MARFDREGKALASLNHPNLAGIHGLEEHDGRRYLVLEYVDGETLEERLHAGALPVDDALDICGQIAAGLEAAHDAGVIHRDLKPANIKITSSGQVKVLDFGLARIDRVSSSQSSMSEAATLMSAGGQTAPGMIMGTPQYMSPEQARGSEVDRRTDIWSLAVILWECLTGVNPFARDTVGDSIAAVLTIEEDLSLLPPGVPGVVVEVLKRCLQKDRRQRMRDAGDVRLLLADAKLDVVSPGETTGLAVPITDCRMRITDEICRTLDRDGFDAQLLGWEMQYADNNRSSDEMIVWIPSFGGDHTTPAWRQLMSASPYRMIVPTVVGMEPGTSKHPVVSLENQLALVRALVRDLRKRLRPKKVVISGFACGSILALRCAAGDDTDDLFDGVLAIDADLQEADCFLSGLFSRIDPTSSSGILDVLQGVSGSCETVEDWISTHEHTVFAVGKMQENFEPLARQGRDLTAPFVGVTTGEKSPFSGWLREAYEHVGVVRCIFLDSPESRRMIGEIRMKHLDSQCLGPKFTDDAFAFIPESTHVGMLRTERLLEYLDLIVAAL